jgi:hypothetical protein
MVKRFYVLVWLLLTACDPAAGLVVVTVKSDTPLTRVARLHVTTTLGPESREAEISTGARTEISTAMPFTFGIEAPPRLGSRLTVVVEARTADDVRLAAGSSTAPLVSAEGQVSFFV